MYLGAFLLPEESIRKCHKISTRQAADHIWAKLSTPWYLFSGPSFFFKPAKHSRVSSNHRKVAVAHATQSSNLYQAPANGKNHGLPLYRPSGAPGKGMLAKGFWISCPPAIASAILLPR
jgi:hypothetical protein